ncbi:hypothetical protein KR093_003193, partial [Drosophila rubida]
RNMSVDNEKYNSDELVPPQWLNAQFFTEILDSYLKKQELKILQVKLAPASAKGDHYTSIMFRAEVEYTTQSNEKSTISLIVKTIPEEQGHKKALLNNSHIFPTEIAMYTEILPIFEKVLHEAGDESKLYVPCIYHSLEPRQVMVFEDLVPQGYAVVRDRPASKEELRAALEKLGKWHAVSHKILQEQPELFEKLQYDVTTLPNVLQEDFMTTALPVFINMLEKVETLRPFKKYFELMQGKIIDRWVDVIREYRENRQPNGFYVVCHGDFH